MSNMQKLRDNLFSAMEGLAAGKISVATANAIAGTGQVLINSLRVELDARKAAGSKQLPEFVNDREPLEELTDEERKVASEDLAVLSLEEALNIKPRGITIMRDGVVTKE